MLKSQTTPIALMTGGNGPERFGSLRSGESVINALTSLGVPHDVYDLSLIHILTLPTILLV